ncbi:hypothetical protein BDR22DRAFT_971360 [Usnea florida]
MLDRRLEDYSHVYEDGLNSNMSEHHQNKLAPLLTEREYDHNSAYHHDTLPSISSRMLEAYLQEDYSAPTETYDSQSLHDKYSFHQPSHDLRRIHAGQGLTAVNGAVIHHNESGRLLLLPVIDQRVGQHAYMYYPHRQPSQWHNSNYDAIDPQLRPTKHHSYPLEPANSVPTSSSPLTQHTPPSLADSPTTHFTSPLNTPPAPQGNQAETAFAHPAELAAINSAMNPPKIAPTECTETCLCSKCCAAVVESDHGQECSSSKTEVEKPTGAHHRNKGSRTTQTKKKTRPRAPKAISKPTRHTRVLRSSSNHPNPPSSSARTKLFNDKLAAVNGVVLPDKLPPGTAPLVHQSKVKNANGKRLTIRCPRCGGLFGKRDHVRSHFVACVGRNGNPEGLRWDEGGEGEGGI